MDVVETIKPIVKVMTDEQLQQVYDLAYDLLDKRGKLPQVKATSRKSGVPRYRGGRAWAKHVTAVDYGAKANGYALEGEFMDFDEKKRKTSVSNGEVVIVKTSSGNVAYGRRMAGSPFSVDDAQLSDFLMSGMGTMQNAIDWCKREGVPQK